MGDTRVVTVALPGSLTVTPVLTVTSVPEANACPAGYEDAGVEAGTRLCQRPCLGQRLAYIETLEGLQITNTTTTGFDNGGYTDLYDPTTEPTAVNITTHRVLALRLGAMSLK